MRPGEKLIDKLESIEDTKGNNGDRGKQLFEKNTCNYFVLRYTWLVFTADISICYSKIV